MSVSISGFLLGYENNNVKLQSVTQTRSAIETAMPMDSLVITQQVNATLWGHLQMTATEITNIQNTLEVDRETSD